MWYIALKTLIADRGKLLTALVGVVFSIVLVNLQGGFFVGLIRKASLLVDHGQADIWIGHKQMHNVDLPLDIPRRWVYRVRGIPGVARAEPYLVGFSDMALPSGGFEGVVVVGVAPGSLLGNAWNLVAGRPEAILQTDGIILDECENVKLEHPQLGDRRELGGREARIVGISHGIMGFLVAPYIFTTYDRAATYMRKSPDYCSYILVKLQPGADPVQTCRAIQQRVPEVDALPRDTYSWISIRFWLTRTGLGISFGAATLLGLFVGLVMVGQTLYALVLDRVTEFGAMKAMGASETQVYTIVMVQATVMALVGSLAGLSIVALAQYFYSTPQAPIVIPWQLSLMSCVLVLTICLISSWLPYCRIRKVDPAMVLQS